MCTCRRSGWRICQKMSNSLANPQSGRLNTPASHMITSSLCRMRAGEPASLSFALSSRQVLPEWFQRRSKPIFQRHHRGHAPEQLPRRTGFGHRHELSAAATASLEESAAAAARNVGESAATAVATAVAAAAAAAAAAASAARCCCCLLLLAAACCCCLLLAAASAWCLVLGA